MKRIDLYTMVHKGLRAELFGAAQTVARTGFDGPEETSVAVERVRTLISFLDEHAEHEDRVVMPEVERLGPAVFSDLQADHNRVGGLQREIQDILNAIEEAAGAERVSLGRRLHQKMGRLVAEHLLHMEREETQANRLLWAHFTNEQLIGLHVRIVSAIAPERMQQWARIFLPAADPEERAELLAGLSRGLPAEVVAELAKLGGSRAESDVVLVAR